MIIKCEGRRQHQTAPSAVPTWTVRAAVSGECLLQEGHCHKVVFHMKIFLAFLLTCAEVWACHDFDFHSFA